MSGQVYFVVFSAGAVDLEVSRPRFGVEGCGPCFMTKSSARVGAFALTLKRHAPWSVAAVGLGLLFLLLGV